jgi:hypothetical protein
VKDGWGRHAVAAAFGGALTAAAALLLWPRSHDVLPQLAVPDGGSCPDVAVVRERVHLVYGEKGMPYYTQSPDGGRSFTAPLRLAAAEQSGDLGHERGPAIALGKDESLHVVWMNSPKAEVFYTRSSDGGRTFGKARNLAAPSAGVDGATLAADAQGRVFVVWAQAGAGPESPVSKTLTLAASSDDGESFAPPKPLESTYPGGACACCALRAAIAPDHALLVGMRGAHRNVRDIYLLRAMNISARFEASRVSADRWVFEGCPMAGPSIDVATAGEIHVAWMSDGQVYRAASRDGGRTFGARTAPVARGSHARTLPLIVSNSSGERLFAWIENRRVLWERISADDRVVAAGDNGRLSADSRAAAFADREGRFVLVR